MEGMACGVPQIVPDWSALGEWARDAARLVPCTSICVAPGNINTVGGVVDEELFVQEMQNMYSNKELRDEHSRRGLELVRKQEYRWANISAQFDSLLQQAMKFKYENYTAALKKEEGECQNPQQKT
jgi:glycosyltransferase involved in cell wall biosynthesis